MIDRDSYEIVYQVETDTFFFDHRMIDHQLYLVSTKYLYTNEDELRPKFIEMSINDSSTSFVDYDDIYYYEDALSSTMTIITSIDLDGLSYDTQAFLGYVNYIYVNENHMFTAYNYYDYEQGDTNSNTYSKIVKFSIDDVNNKMIYQGSQTIKGHILSNYWMDEYDGYLRVVTTTFWPFQNRLYVLV